MNSMLATIVPKSDQLNADDLMAGQTKTIKVTKVTIASGDQPVSLSFEGDGGKPYKPGKSMRRVLVHVWGADANAYIGRSMTLYRDDKVMFGGVNVGGIRISHMSDISGAITMALTATKASRKPFTVQPLAVAKKAEPLPLEDAIFDISLAETLESLADKYKAAYKLFTDKEQRQKLEKAKDVRKGELTAPPPPVDHLEQLLAPDDEVAGDDD